jgi:pyruvate carboxylase
MPFILVMVSRMLILLKSRAQNNIIFIGPKSKAIHIMGSKLAAKEAVKNMIFHGSRTMKR